MNLIFIFLFTVLICAAGVSIKSVTNPIQHAEGPHWDDKEQILYYVNTFQAEALRWDPKTGRITTFKLDDRNSIGIIVPIKGNRKDFVVGADRYIYKVTWNGKENNTAKFEEILMVDQSKPKNQFNDGKADAKGRLWIGTLTRNTDQSVTNFGGELFVIDGRPLLRDQPTVRNTSISNGLAWSKNNRKFYYIDSEVRNVRVYDFDLERGVISNGKILFDLANYPDIQGIPDGMTIDSNDNLWVAMYGGGYVLKVHGTSGCLLQRVTMPVTYVTSLAFGGPKFDKLYATTSRMKLNDSEVLLQPLAGSVLEITNLGVKGLPANEFVLKTEGNC